MRRPTLALALVLLLAACTLLARGQAAPGAAGPDCPTKLPLPTEVGAERYEALLYEWLDGRCYEGWEHDREIRNTGPFIDNTNFGTHPAVRVYYSPEVWEWMTTGKREGEIEDGGIIVKEMYTPPASPTSPLTSWTVMVKDRRGAWDGWYWSYHGVGDKPQNPLEYPNSGFGLYCTRCHGSAERELTFAAVRNVSPHEDPLSFVVQELTTVAKESPDEGPASEISPHRNVAAAEGRMRDSLVSPLPAPDPAFLRLFRLPPEFVRPTPKTAFPAETYDHVVSGPEGPEQFLTSDQCVGCHSASTFNMAFLSADGRDTVNLSPYGEWRASMMGLAGRDPVFHAQRESEVERLGPGKETFVDTTCYRCHGVMGQRQAAIDGTSFEHRMIFALPGEPGAKYGALARDGISCMSCHQVADEALGDTSTFTGRFRVDPPGHVNGPYPRVTEFPMREALGVTPRFGAQIRSSALCGSCHTVVLPVFDRRGRQLKTIYEQTTYPEWLNSVFQNEAEPFDADSARTCQSCHMPRSYQGNPLRYRIANIEDPTYPAADHRARDSLITVAVRDTFSRHMLAGINLFTLAMFQQFPDTLGIRRVDYMYSSGVQPLVQAGRSGLALARDSSARVTVESVRGADDALEVVVDVRNLAGHGLPSGVEFRRAFIELVVEDAAGRPLWASGRTSPLGVILRGTTEEALTTEFFTRRVAEGGVFQPHHEVVTREDQVQIYEELVMDPEGWLTTSFLALDSIVKNNRLLPRGWRRDGPFAEVTHPHGGAARDPDFFDGRGHDRVVYRIPRERARGAVRVRASLYYQALPPYYLAQRFQTKGEETRRLAFLTSRLRVEGTPIESWKLLLHSDARAVPRTAVVARRR